MTNTTAIQITVSNLSMGVQRTVGRNVVTFKVGDFVGSRLRGEHITGVVTAVQGMDYITLERTCQHGENGTYDSNYFYIIRGIDETDAEVFSRRINHRELTR